jgi:hypothetical protein
LRHPDFPDHHPAAFMAQSESDPFSRALGDRLTDLRLRVDLGEITTAAAFRNELEQDRRFQLTDPRVRAACERAGFGHWTG